MLPLPHISSLGHVAGVGLPGWAGPGGASLGWAGAWGVPPWVGGAWCGLPVGPLLWCLDHAPDYSQNTQVPSLKTWALVLGCQGQTSRQCGMGLGAPVCPLPHHLTSSGSRLTTSALASLSVPQTCTECLLCARPHARCRDAAQTSPLLSGADTPLGRGEVGD